VDVSALDAIDVHTHVGKCLIDQIKPALYKHNAARLLRL
jgi:hypothetical protein